MRRNVHARARSKFNKIQCVCVCVCTLAPGSNRSSEVIDGLKCRMEFAQVNYQFPVLFSGILKRSSK